MERRGILQIDEAITSSKQALRPCRSCDLNPISCKKQSRASFPGFNSGVNCDEKGIVIRREERFIRLERVNLGGKFETDTKIPAAEAAGL